MVEKKVPAAHAVHVDWPEVLAKPSAHRVQLALAVELAEKPGAHAAHVVVFVEKRPGWQGSHADLPVVAVAKPG